MILKHLCLTNSFVYPILMSGFSLMLLADIAVMAYLYKVFYGRLIVNEVLSNDVDEDTWKYDDKTHKYIRKTDADYEVEKAMDNVKSDYYSKKINEIREELVDEKNDDIP